MSQPELDHAAGPAAPVIRVLTRLGFAAKGLVTILVGTLALRYALRKGGGITDQEGAVEWVLHHALGRWMLGVLAVGLAGYAVWMFVAAVLDPERKGRGFQGIAERLGFLTTGIGYVVLAYTAFALLLGRHDAGGYSVKQIVAMVLTPHLGRAAVGLAGLIVMVAGVFQLRLGITGGFRDLLEPGLSRLELMAVDLSGRLGYLALSLLSLMVGWSLVQVAVQYDPSQVDGWRDALWLLAGMGSGRVLLAAAATGLICYGLFFVLQVRYRKL
jgi:Domain of Unknown Function (DUF1206)